MRCVFFLGVLTLFMLVSFPKFMFFVLLDFVWSYYPPTRRGVDRLREMYLFEEYEKCIDETFCRNWPEPLVKLVMGSL